MQDGTVPLHGACYGGHLHVVEFLLGVSKKSIDGKAKDGYTPLLIALERGHKDVAVALLDAGAQMCDVESLQHIVASACESGDANAVQHVMDKSIIAADVVDALDNSTALHRACAQGYWEIAQELLAAGAIECTAPCSHEASLFEAAFECKDINRMLTVVWLLTGHVQALDPSPVLDLMKSSINAGFVEAMHVCLQQWAVEKAEHSDLTVVPIEVFSRGSTAVASYLQELANSPVSCGL
ncbi:hypothetical protein ATCC90586_010707 [Pythium insidiosum]|nr:hypothetical protein ATCC90586_010707 [Pythium insidiosum]